jgi:hypothetical protein
MEITVWIKIKNQFIKEKNIRGIARHFDKTRIMRIVGDDVIVDVPYEKLKKIIKL